MRLEIKMLCLGVIEKEKKATKEKYKIAKFMDEESKEIYEFYVGDDLQEELKKVKDFNSYTCIFELYSKNGQPSFKLTEIN